MTTILIIEDDLNINELIKFNLEISGYKTITASDGISGITMAYRYMPDLILLDLMLPEKSGIEICKELRNNNIDIPIIMLTAKSKEEDRVLGLDIGADDYISKPFGIKELVSRVKAVLRRSEKSSNSSEEEKIVFENIILDKSTFKLFINNREIELTIKEFQLIWFLAENRGKIYNRNQLLDKIWSVDYIGDGRTIDVHISHIRKKIEDIELIETIRGRGYRWKEN